MDENTPEEITVLDRVLNQIKLTILLSTIITAAIAYGVYYAINDQVYAKPVALSIGSLYLAITISCCRGELSESPLVNPDPEKRVWLYLAIFWPGYIVWMLLLCVITILSKHIPRVSTALAWIYLCGIYTPLIIIGFKPIAACSWTKWAQGVINKRPPYETE